MKDDYKRRRKAENHLIRTVADVESCQVVTPIHQEALDTECECAMDVWIQENEFVVTSTDKWCLQVYVLDRTSTVRERNVDSTSEFSDEALIPAHSRNPVWCAIPRETGYYENLSSVTFISPDVIGCITATDVSTWYVRSGEPIETMTIGGKVRLESSICKINDNEFVVGSMEGHMLVFTHNRGRNIREIMRIRKAHSGEILSMAIHKQLMVSTSNDWSARLWDVTTKKRIAILKHGANVVGVSLSDEYIITCSFNEFDTGELRIYNNDHTLELVKILHVSNKVYKPTIIDDSHILFRLYLPINNGPLPRHYLCIVNFKCETILAQLQVGCRIINDYQVTPDGRIVVVGLEGCSGVVAKLPRRLRKLITSNSADDGRRGMCSLM